MKTTDDSIDQAILSALEERQGNVSGEDLGGRVGISRAAVWKRIQALRNDGYEITARSNRGYSLLQKPDILSWWEIGRNLRANKVVREIRTFEEVTSTNDLAYEMALRGGREGVIVVAEAQTRGRGRMNRSWFSPSGKNLYLSLILRPPIPLRLVPLLTYLGAISTAEALYEAFSLEVDVKWPNDILVRGKKLAGLLNEMKAEEDRVDFVVLGFGVNLNIGLETFPSELIENTTSVMRELGHRVSRVKFTRHLLERIDAWYETLLSKGASPIIEKWEAVARIRGKFLEVRSFGEIHRGFAEGLDYDGALILCEGKDQRIRIVAGDVKEASV
jgi:BirA family biotin operon repressor/biotin-[acetyl-CoA-carboxylase] ligase